MAGKRPYTTEDLLKRGRQRTFTGSSLAEVAFPLGGIGTGTICLGGRGNLRDWEVFNHPAKGRNLPMTFFAVWAKQEGKDPVAKILERQLLPPFTGSGGHDRSNLGGVGRLSEAKFGGEYPFASIEFQDRKLPVKATLEAFNPFVPLNVDDSSIPVAIFNWRFENRSAKPVELSLMATMTNPLGSQNIGVESEITAFRNEFRREADVRGLYFTAPELSPQDPNYGTFALTTPWPQADAQPRLYRGGWWDSAHILWDDFSSDGRLQPGENGDAVTHSRPEPGAMALQATVRPRESVVIPVMISWHMPYLKAWTDGTIVRTYMSSQFEDAWDVAQYTTQNLERLTAESQNWHDAIFGSSLPPYVIDAVTSQASIIRTNTCLRLADGQFYGYEGCSDGGGCCSGTCMHVWNYEQALAFLFPSLERSIRRNEFLNSTSNNGHMAFRSSMPANTRMGHFHACGDGQMGSIIRAYRDWRLSGDDAFLREIWPNVKKALEYAWTESNGWDPNKDGVMEGCQHNTYDIEFYGPNTMMGAMYLGALKAAERIAAYLGEADKAEEYRSIFESGRARTEAELWNGEYYIQKVEVRPGLEVPERLRGPVRDEACGEACACKDTPDEKTPALQQDFEVKYQYGEGCLSDQLLGQWASHVAGLGYVLDPERVKETVHSIFRHNFRYPIGDFDNVQRIYALNDEAGLLLCSWPHGNRPQLPFVYSDEVWTGIEYQVAAHLIYEGLTEEGLAVVKGVRDRHDGVRRNPWDEFECGHHYARAMASWSVLLALSGFRYDAVAKSIGFVPQLSQQNFRTAFTTASGWGVFSQRASKRRMTAALEMGYGSLELASLWLNWPGEEPPAPLSVTATVDGTDVRAEASLESLSIAVRFHDLQKICAGQALKVTIT